MSRPTATIAEILETASQPNDLHVTATVEGQSVEILSTNDVRFYLFEHYYEWSVFTTGTTKQEKYEHFKFVFQNFISEMQASIDCIYGALIKEYDPTGDYSRHETTAYKNTHEIEYGKTATNTATDYESKTEYNSTVADDIKTYDSVQVGDAHSMSKSGDDTTTINGTMETAITGTDTITDTRLAADNVRDVVGNNNAPQQSIIDEISLRIENDITDIVMNQFAKKFLFLLPEVD